MVLEGKDVPEDGESSLGPREADSDASLVPALRRLAGEPLGGGLGGPGLEGVVAVAIHVAVECLELRDEARDVGLAPRLGRRKGGEIDGKSGGRERFDGSEGWADA